MVLASLNLHHFRAAGVALLGGHRWRADWFNGFKDAAAVAAPVQPQGEPEGKEPKLARRSPFVLATRLCPRCLNPLTPRNELGGWLVPQDYFCSKCGYSGTVFVEKESADAPEEK